jgi:hypothetical protein
VIRANSGTISERRAHPHQPSHAIQRAAQTG